MINISVIESMETHGSNKWAWVKLENETYNKSFFVSDLKLVHRLVHRSSDRINQEDLDEVDKYCEEQSEARKFLKELRAL